MTWRTICRDDTGLVMHAGIPCEVWRDMEQGRLVLVAAEVHTRDALTPLADYQPAGVAGGDATLLALAELWQLANRLQPDEAATIVEVAKGWIEQRERARRLARFVAAVADVG